MSAGGTEGETLARASNSDASGSGGGPPFAWLVAVSFAGVGGGDGDFDARFAFFDVVPAAAPVFTATGARVDGTGADGASEGIEIAGASTFAGSDTDTNVGARSTTTASAGGCSGSR